MPTTTENLAKLLTALHLKQVQDFDNLIKLIKALDIKDKELSEKLEGLKGQRLEYALTNRDIKVITDRVLSLIPPIDKDRIIQDVLKQIPKPKVIEKKSIQIFPRESLDVDKVVGEVLKKVPLPELPEPFKLTKEVVDEIAAFLDAKNEKWLDAKSLRNLEENIDPQKLKIPAPTIVNRYHSTEFRRLQDTPDDIQAGKFLRATADGQKLEWVDEPAGGGVVTPTGDVNGSNTDFAIDSEPSMVTYDTFPFMPKDLGTWTWDGVKIVTDFPPSQFIRCLR